MINRSQVLASFRPPAALLFFWRTPLATALLTLIAALAAPAWVFADEGDKPAENGGKRGWAASSGANGLGRTNTTGFRFWAEVGGGEEVEAVIVPTLGVAFRYDVIEAEVVLPMIIVDDEYAIGNPKIGANFFRELDIFRLRAGFSFNFPLPVGERDIIRTIAPDQSPGILIQNQRRANWYSSDTVSLALSVSHQVDAGPVTFGLDGEYLQLLPTCSDEDAGCPSESSLFINTAASMSFWAFGDDFQGGVRALFTYSPTTTFIQSQFGIEPYAVIRIDESWLVAIRTVLPITPLDLGDAWGAFGSIVFTL